MKQLNLAFIASCLLIACSNNQSADTATNRKDSSNENGNYAYKPTYSSDFKMGDPKHAQLVLDVFKSFEENRLNDSRDRFADSVWVEFANGMKINVPKDTLIKMGNQERAQMSSLTTAVDAWMPVHTNDKNEDYVLIWEKDYTTNKSGKVDSFGVHSVWQIKNNKVSGWAEYRQQLSGPQMPAEKK